jgi:uncharacterized membrane protein YjgN (DUF898 family)
VTQTPPPGQPPFVPPGQYGAPPYAFLPPEHREATTVLILGILGLVLCQVISPFAWVMGNRVIAEIDASNGQVGGRSQANAGRICGIVGTVLIGLGLLIAAAAVIIVLIAAAQET